MKYDKNSLRLLALSFRAVDGIINGELPKIIHKPQHKAIHKPRNQGLCDRKTAFILIAKALKECEPVYIHPDKRAKNRAKRKVRK